MTTWAEQNTRGRQLAADLVERLRETDDRAAFATDAARIVADEPEGVCAGFWFAMAAAAC